MKNFDKDTKVFSQIKKLFVLKLKINKENHDRFSDPFRE